MEKYFDRHDLANRGDLGERIRDLIRWAGEGESANAALYEQMLRTLVHFIGESPDRWDTKILARTLREMTSTFSRLRPYRRRRKVTVYGSARTPEGDPDYILARELGARLAEHDHMVITGAGGGIMQAAHEGAGVDNCFGFNIALPHEQSANPVIDGDDKLVTFRFFFTRKLFFVKEADAIVLCPGGFGTQDEAFELITLLQTGKSPVIPIVLLDAPTSGYWAAWSDFVRGHMHEPARISAADPALWVHVHTAQEAVEEIHRFYSNFHSTRWVGKELIVRHLHPITDEQLAAVNRDFGDLCLTGSIERRTAHPQEAEESELSHLPRLGFAFRNRNFGRLRQFIDAINGFAPRDHSPS